MGLYEIPPDNTPVSRYELSLALNPIRDDLRDLKMSAASKTDMRALGADVSELGADVKAWKVVAERQAFLGGRGRSVANALIITGGSSLIGAVIALLVGGGGS